MRRAEARSPFAAALDGLDGNHLGPPARREVNAQQPDRPATEHEHPAIRAEPGRRQGGDADGQRFHQRGDIVAQALGHLQQGGARYGDPIGEDSRAVQAQQLAARAEVLSPGEACFALPANDQREDRPAPRKAGDGAHHLVS
jgi:hypothetical protein